MALRRLRVIACAEPDAQTAVCPWSTTSVKTPPFQKYVAIFAPLNRYLMEC